MPATWPYVWRVQTENAAPSCNIPTMSRNQPQVFKSSKITKRLSPLK